MKCNVLSVSSPFHPSYVRRLWVIGLAALAGATGVWAAVDVGTKTLFGILILMSFAGVFTRVSLIGLVIVSIGLWRLQPFENSLVDFYLDFGLILMAARSFDVLSFDAAMQAKARADQGCIEAPPPSAVYAWPIRILWIYGFLALALSHPSDFMTMTIFVCVYAVTLVDWPSLFQTLSGRIFSDPMFVVYDGNCKLCRRTAAVLNSMDEFGRLTYVNGMNGQDLKRHGLDHLDRTKLAQDMHVVHRGKTFLGAFGYRCMAARIPILWLTIPILYLSPVIQAAQKIYRRIADGRGCSILPEAELRWIDPPVKPLDVIAPAVVAILLAVGHTLRG